MTKTINKKGNVGRPLKPTSEKRLVKINFYITEEEEAKFKEFALSHNITLTSLFVDSANLYIGKSLIPDEERMMAARAWLADWWLTTNAMDRNAFLLKFFKNKDSKQAAYYGHGFTSVEEMLEFCIKSEEERNDRKNQLKEQRKRILAETDEINESIVQRYCKLRKMIDDKEIEDDNDQEELRKIIREAFSKRKPDGVFNNPVWEKELKTRCLDNIEECLENKYQVLEAKEAN